MNRWIALALSAALLASTANAAGETATLPGWLAGAWHMEKSGEWTEERWSPPRAGQMIGTSRTGKGDMLGSWELLRIEMDAKGAIALLAAPGGKPPTRFDRTSSSPTGIVFANPAHDYPQKIGYRLEGKRLVAEISKMDGSQAMRWTYERTRF